MNTKIKIWETQIGITELIKRSTDSDVEDGSVYICDLDDICNKHIKWITSLPRVEPHYAVKCNNDKKLLKLLAFLRTGFSCTSKNEIQTVLDLGVSPDRIIYANPCKQASYIRYAYKNGINTMTFDNEQELYKIKANHPNAKIVLRIITNDVNAVCRFSMKFGADMITSYKLIDLAIKLDLDLVGISFHVGSGQMSPAAFSESIQNARTLFDYASEKHNCQMTLLDLGGGYPGSSDSADLFASIAKEINNTLDLYFPENDSNDGKKVRIVAEPGRYYACSAFTLCVNIIAKRIINEDIGDKSIMYYINDGLYVSFHFTYFDPTIKLLPIIVKDIPNDASIYKTNIWGPTCDCIDFILKEAQLPELDVGDFLMYKNMGAYTLTYSTVFNSMPIAKVIYTVSTELWKTIINAFNEIEDQITTQYQSPFVNTGMCCADSTNNMEKITHIDELPVDENCVVQC